MEVTSKKLLWCHASVKKKKMVRRHPGAKRTIRAAQTKPKQRKRPTCYFLCACYLNAPNLSTAKTIFQQRSAVVGEYACVSPCKIRYKLFFLQRSKDSCVRHSQQKKKKTNDFGIAPASTDCDKRCRHNTSWFACPLENLTIDFKID
jgi:hypothetical protein